MQATALQNLHEHAVVTHKNLADESKRIEKILSSHLFPRSHSTLVYSGNYHYSNSQAELTIEKHSDPVPTVDLSSKPLVVKKDGQSYPEILLMDIVVGTHLISLAVSTVTLLVTYLKKVRTIGLPQFAAYTSRNSGHTYQRLGRGSAHLLNQIILVLTNKSQEQPRPLAHLSLVHFIKPR